MQLTILEKFQLVLITTVMILLGVFGSYTVNITVLVLVTLFFMIKTFRINRPRDKRPLE